MSKTEVAEAVYLIDEFTMQSNESKAEKSLLSSESRRHRRRATMLSDGEAMAILRVNMKNRDTTFHGKRVARRRPISETINDTPHDMAQVRQSRHRPITNPTMNITSALAA